MKTDEQNNAFKEATIAQLQRDILHKSCKHIRPFRPITGSTAGHS